MSRRKKSPGFNPRNKAREELTVRMNSIIGIYDGVADEISKFSSRIKHEEETISKFQNDALRQFSLEVLSSTSAGLVGLSATVHEQGTVLLSRVDSAATAVMNIINSHERWADIKDDVLVAELSIDASECDFNEFLREAQLTLLELYRYYADRIEFVRDFMKAGGTLEEAKAKIAEGEAAAAAAETAEPQPANEPEHKEELCAADFDNKNEVTANA